MTVDSRWADFERDLILERFGRTVPELPAHEREEKRKADRAFQKRLEELAAERNDVVGLVLPFPAVAEPGLRQARCV